MYIFVYGTLLKGEHNHRCLRTDQSDGAKFVKEDMIVGRLFATNGYPFCVLNPTLATLPTGNNLVLGEVYEISDIDGCDRLEGYDKNRPEDQNLFNRRQRTTQSGLDVYVYEGGQRFLNSLSDFMEIPDNNWKTYNVRDNTLLTAQNEKEQQHILASELSELFDDDDPESLKNIIFKIVRNRNLSSKHIDALFNRNVTKVQLIDCIKLLVKTIDENI